ncbi:MAG: hypothetical protein AAF528_02795 [Cyanobacteria bacterium P01_C01_bin.121]
MNQPKHQRYEGKPLLRLLECYVLFSIGELPDSNRKKLNEMTPKLSAVYKHSGTWTEILEKQMNFPEQMQTEIDKVWKKNTLLAEKEGKILDPEHFAQSFVDRNFSF